MTKIDFSQVITAEAQALAAQESFAAAMRVAVDAHVEATARSRSYNSAAHCASYAPSTVPTWAAEAAAFIAWRDAVWLSVFAQMQAIIDGEAPMPSGSQDVIDALPEIEWPE